MKKFFTAVFILTFLGLAVYFNLYHGRKEAKEVTMERIGLRELKSIVSASGKLKAHREVDLSGNVMGRILKLGVREGDNVRVGDFLFLIDPVPFETAITRFKAGIALERAGLEVAKRSTVKASKDYAREKKLAAKGMVPTHQLEAARLNLKVKEGEVLACRLRIEQQKANLVRAEHEFTHVRCSATISGKVTSLNVEEGENVITGTMNNPGTVLMTISDMSILEVELEVDETEVVHLSKGQAAEVNFDAFPDKKFKALVDRVAPGPEGGLVRLATAQRAVNYLVVLRMIDPVPNARIGLTATADITTCTRDKTLCVPISAVTLREFLVDEKDERIPEHDFDLDQALKEPALDPVSGEPKKKEFQGIFVLVPDEAKGRRVSTKKREGLARFYPVKLGISGDRYFEVLSGLEEKMVVITGPYKKLRELKEGDPAREKVERKKRKRDRRLKRLRRMHRRRLRKKRPSKSGTVATTVSSR